MSDPTSSVPHITVTVSGASGVGKSAVLQRIHIALRDAGYNVHLIPGGLEAPTVRAPNHHMICETTLQQTGLRVGLREDHR